MSKVKPIRAQREPQEDGAVHERHGIRKGLYLVPSIFTTLNIAAGFYSVMASLRAFQLVGSGGAAELTRASALFDNGAKAIGFAVVCDALDGRIARMTRTTTEIGVQLDSIADVLSFGIAPAVLAYTWGYGSALRDGSDAHQLAWFLSFMYLMCGAFRLARFNVQAARPRVLAEGTPKVDKNYFVGLPIPAAAALIAAIVHFAPQPLVMYKGNLPNLYSGLLMALVGVLGGLMVSTLRYSSFKSAGTRRRSTRVMILLVGAVGMMVWLYSRYVLLAIITSYILQGFLQRIAAFFRRRTEKETPLPQ